MFKSARLKLTAWYLLIIMSISLVFSAIIYQTIDREIDRFARIQRFRIERRLGGNLFFSDESGLQILPPQSPLDPQLIGETRARIILNLGLINGVILVLAGASGYLLAGRTLKPIQLMVEDQNRFVGDASHELRTPLSSLKTSFEVSLRDKHISPTDIKTLLLDGLEDISKLQSLSDSLLKLSRYQETSKLNSRIRLSLHQPVTQAIKRLKNSAAAKNIKVSTDTAKIRILGNCSSLTDAFAAIIDNAIKYSPPGSAITINSATRAGFAVTTITDQGIGIDPKDLPHIFKRFYRADTSRSSLGNSVGYGLGLAIAKKIIEQHSGTVSVKSKVGKGTKFIVSLPLYS
jgi:two-component system sensor histidine kinase CiaH